MDNVFERRPHDGTLPGMDPDISHPTPADRPELIRDGHDLLACWRALMGELGFAERKLWLLFVERDGSVAPHVTQVAELPAYPDDERLDGLMYVCGEVMSGLGDGASVAILISRPGGGGASDADRSWASRIVAAARRNRVTMYPVHLANDERLRVVAADDLIGAA